MIRGYNKKGKKKKENIEKEIVLFHSPIICNRVICMVTFKSILPYPGQLGKIPNALCCLLPVATQQVCKFSSVGCQHAIKKCLRAFVNDKQLGSCFI